ncbi:hypothetical protein D9619_010915 [Psilocybe cf. subviscida]|uniref:Uncharacterized protein n=1 Tax=Psilocybe cf. subviscida TaxID=2480587 RepID=A0A8H5F053_9AGAR|nr:hypothetical protein D9619_010915 [Psilocybe cf. subviscida]
MGIYTTLSASDNLSLGGPKTLIQLAIAGLTFCTHAVDIYMAMPAPPPSHYTPGTIDFISSTKFISKRVVASTKHASLIASTKSSPTTQAARTMPIQLSISTTALPTPSHLGFIIVFLAICALFMVLAGTAVLHSTSGTVASGHTGVNCPGPNTNQASTASDGAASNTPSPTLGRRSGGSGGGDEPFSSGDAPDNIVKKEDGDEPLLTSARNDPPPPDGPPPPSPPTDDPEDGDNHSNVDDFWTIILMNLFAGAFVGLLIRGIRAFNRRRYFAALRRAGKPEQELVVAIPGPGLAAAVASSNGSSVSLHDKSRQASLSEGVSLRQTSIALAGLLSLDSFVPKSDSVSVPVVKSPMPSCTPRHGLQHSCSPRPQGTSRPMDGAPPTEDSEPLLAPQRRPTAHKPLRHETVESPVQIKADKSVFNLMLALCGLYLVVALALIPSLLRIADSEPSLSKDPFNDAGQGEVVALEAADHESLLTPKTTPTDEEHTYVSSLKYTVYARRKRGAPANVIPKEILEATSIDPHDLCSLLDNFHQKTIKVAHNASRCPSSIRFDQEQLSESQNVEQYPPPSVLSEPLQLADSELTKDALEQPNGYEDLASMTVPRVTSLPITFEALENAVDGEPSYVPDTNISEDPVAKSEDPVAEASTTDLESSTLTLASYDYHQQDEPIAPEEELTPQPEVGASDAEDVSSKGEHVQLDSDSPPTLALQTATEANASVDSTPADCIPVDVDDTPADDASVDDALVDDTPVDNVPLDDTPLALPLPPATPATPAIPATPSLPAIVPAPSASPVPPAAPSPQSPEPNPSTPSAEAGPSSAASHFQDIQGHHCNLACEANQTGIPQDDEISLGETFMAHVHREPRKMTRRGRRGNKRKKSSSSTGDTLSEAVQTEPQPTEIQDDGNVLVHENHHPESDAPPAAAEPAIGRSNGKGEEKDSSEYPISESSTVKTSRSQPQASEMVNGTSSRHRVEDTHPTSDSSSSIAGPSTASPHRGQDLVIEAGPAVTRDVGKGKEREKESGASSTAIESSATELSHHTAEIADEGAQIDPVNTTGKVGNGKGKEKDPSEYPQAVAGPSTADGSRLPRIAPGPPLPTPTGPSFPPPGDDQRPYTDSPHTSSQRSKGKGKGKEKRQMDPQSSVAGTSTAEALPRHGKRRRRTAEILERSQTKTETRGSSSLDSIYASGPTSPSNGGSATFNSIHAPRPALPSNRPRPNPSLHPVLAAAVPNASPSGILLSQLREPCMVPLDSPIRTAITQQPEPPAVQPGPTASAPRILSDPGHPSSPSSPLLPARTMDLDHHVRQRRQSVPPRRRRSHSDHGDAEVVLGSPEGSESVRRRASFSDSFCTARRVAVAWGEEDEAGEVEEEDGASWTDAQPQRPSSPDRPRGSAASYWATREEEAEAPGADAQARQPLSPGRPRGLAASRWATM